MKHKLIYDNTLRTFAVIFGEDDIFPRHLLEFATEQNLTASSFTGIGACKSVLLGWFDPERREYRRIEVNEQVEIVSLVGHISESEEGQEPVINAQVVAGRSDGSTRGGHLLQAHVWPTLELIVTEAPSHLRRRFNPEVGLSLVEL